jgi:hypothetical protein
MDCRKVEVDRETRHCVCLKAIQLRMVPIAAGLQAQHRASEQSFAPQRNQAFRIKVSRMDCPKSHLAPRD